jgi:hypothetical protein
VADEGEERWPLAISSFSQVKDVVEGARWRAPRARRATKGQGKGKP